MTPELKLAQFLSSDEDKQKLASEMEALSVEELKGLLKEANGDMLQYFQDHPEKLKEKQERDAKKEKKASDSRTMTNESPETKVTHTLEKDKKVSTQDKLKMADAWGRELAQKEKSAEKDTDRAKKYGRRGALAAGAASVAGTANRLHTFSKAGLKPLEAIKNHKGLAAGVLAGGTLANAGIGYAAGRLTHRAVHGKTTGKEVEKKAAGVIPGASLNKARDAVMSAAKRMGSGAHKAVSGAAKSLGSIKDPISRGAAVGAAAGGVGGAAQGFLDPKENSMTGEKHRLKSALRKGLGGAAATGATGALFGAMAKSSSVQKLAAALEKRALNMQGIGSMAKNFVGQMKPVAQKAMTAAKPLAQKAMGALKSPGVGQAAGMGAMAGGAAGAVKGLVAPGRDANGQSRGRISGAMNGAAGGAAMGAIGAGGGKALASGMPLKR